MMELSLEEHSAWRLRLDLNLQMARLALEDGSWFEGPMFGAFRSVMGEVVFNTGMVGYPETMTDPSYSGQILVMTSPMVGNYGIPPEECEEGMRTYFESDNIHVRGLIVVDCAAQYSHWMSTESLSGWMSRHGIPGIMGVDTRALTRKLRNQGTQRGWLLCPGDSVPPTDDLHSSALVAHVSVREPVTYVRGNRKIVLVDCGVKNSIIRAFLNRDITVIRVPWDYDFSAETADGFLISNGPGDPRFCGKTIENTRKILSSSKPVLGICLGSQILGLAAGAETYKLPFGHRGQNQPCVENGVGRCYITSQNHGYAVARNTLPQDWREWFHNINDQTNEGIIHISKPFFGTQFHPEASPGPDDTEFVFDMFIRAMIQ